jgi:hypothetical protein
VRRPTNCCTRRAKRARVSNGVGRKDMQQDGSIDYRNYTLPQLREALSAIDGSKYPINLENLKAELATRPVPLRTAAPTSEERVVLRGAQGRSVGAAIFFGFCWFLFFWFVVGGIFAAAMTTIAGKGAGKNLSESYAAGREYGQEIGRKYGSYFCYGGLVLSIIGTVAGVLPGTRRGSQSSRAQQAVAADRPKTGAG